MSLLRDTKRLEKRVLPEVRQSIADKVSRGYIEKTFAAQEVQFAEEVMRLLANDPDYQVRRVLAFNLTIAHQVPHDIVLQLAQDNKEVALPLLTYSRLLTDEDLVTIIKKRKESAIGTAIAMRERLSRSVASVLISTHMRDVVLSLLANKKADISDHGYHDIMDYFSSDQRVLTLVVERGDLSVPVMQKLFKLLSEPLKIKLCSLYHLDRRTLSLSPALPESDESLLNTLSSGDVNEVEGLEWLCNRISQHVAQLYRNGQLTPSILLRSLYEGNILFFERAIARLTELPVAVIKVTVRGKEFEKLALLYQKASIPQNLHQAIMVLLEFALLHKRYDLRHVEEMEENAIYKKQLIEHIASGGYEQTVPLMSYIKAIICTNIQTEDLMVSFGITNKKSLEVSPS